jgi:hypothetical protein
MRVKVRAIEPRIDEAELEELVTEPTAARPRRLTASDLGPNGNDVLDLLSRASSLTPAECRSLDKEAAWRWWMVSPLLSAGLPAARAVALVRGRSDGRFGALAALETAVAAITLGSGSSKAGHARLRACISNAGLALLVRDLIEPEAFTTLSGPWREVMHD